VTTRLIVSSAQILAAAGEPDPRGPFCGLRLTIRQVAVLRLLACGHTHRQVAQRTGMTRAAVEQHVARARAAAGADTTAQVVYLATKAGLLDGPVPVVPPYPSWARGGEG
jgi:DNA-binding NarL/FixJ family response regulator